MAHKARARHITLAVICLLCIASFGAAWAYLEIKEDRIRAGIRQRFERELYERFGFMIQASSFQVNFNGLTLTNLSVANAGSDQPIFTTEKISLHFRWWDWLRENFSGSVEVDLRKPRLHVDQFLLSPNRGSWKAFLQLMDRIDQNSVLRLEEGVVVWRSNEGDLSSITGEFRNESFDLQMRFNHMRVHTHDVSVKLLLQGQLVRSSNLPQKLICRLQTEGTILNWKPVPKESFAEFVVGPDEIEITRADVMEGILVTGRMRREERGIVKLAMHTTDYPLSLFDTFVTHERPEPLVGLVTATLALEGNWLEPMLRGDITIKETRMGDYELRNLQLNVQGVYPDLGLNMSRVVLTDGTTMSFSDEQIRFSELFQASTYKRLIRKSDQEDVRWGSWYLARNQGGSSLEHDVKDSLKLRYEESEPTFYQTEATRREVEMEYLLSESNSLKVRKMDDGEFIGVERKVSF